MTQANVQTRPPMPEIAHPDWEAQDALKHLADVEYVGKMEAVVFRFADGRIFGVPVLQVGGPGRESGNPGVSRVPMVTPLLSNSFPAIGWRCLGTLFFATPTRPTPIASPSRALAEESERRRVDQVIGERVRRERRARK